MKKYIITILLLSIGFYAYAGDLTKGKTFTRNEEVSNTDLHNLVDKGVINPEFISDKTDVTSTDSDYIVIWDATDSALKKVDMSEVRGAGTGAAPIDADYLVGTANTTLTAEIAVGTTPGGELGGSWATPTIDSTHSGSAHHSAVTVSDTTTIDLTLSTQALSADSLHTAGDALTLTGADFDFDGGASPSGDLGGSWATPSVDDDSHNHVYSNIDETTSSNWIGRVSDETGTGKWVFGTSPTFTTGITVPNDSISAAELNEGDTFTWTGIQNFSSAGVIGVLTSEVDTLYSVVARQGVAGADISASNILVTSGTASATNVDTQYLEYSGGTDLIVRDSLQVNEGLSVTGDVTADNISGDKTIQFTITEPDQLDEAGHLVVWSNESAETFNVTSIKGWSDDTTNIILKKMDSNGGNQVTLTDMSVDSVGTNVVSGTGTASNATVTTTQVIYYDYDIGTPDYIKVSIIGGY